VKRSQREMARERRERNGGREGVKIPIKGPLRRPSCGWSGLGKEEKDFKEKYVPV